jgi:hypothetical protein
MYTHAQLISTQPPLCDFGIRGGECIFAVMSGKWCMRGLSLNKFVFLRHIKACEPLDEVR